MPLAQLGGASPEALGERRGLVRLAGRAGDAPRRLRLPFERLPRVLLRFRSRVRRFEHATLAREHGLAHRVGDARRLLTLRLERGELAPQLGQLGPPTKRTGPGRRAGEPDGAARVDERAAAF